MAPNVVRVIPVSSLSPTLNDNFCVCKELKDFSSVAFDISEKGSFCPAKGEERHRCCNAKVDSHHAGYGAVFEFPGCFAIRGIETGGVSVFTVFDQSQTLIQILDMNEGDNRSEDLL